MVDIEVNQYEKNSCSAFKDNRTITMSNITLCMNHEWWVKFQIQSKETGLRYLDRIVDIKPYGYLDPDVKQAVNQNNITYR